MSEGILLPQVLHTVSAAPGVSTSCCCCCVDAGGMQSLHRIAPAGAFLQQYRHKFAADSEVDGSDERKVIGGSVMRGFSANSCR